VVFVDQSDLSSQVLVDYSLVYGRIEVAQYNSMAFENITPVLSNDDKFLSVIQNSITGSTPGNLQVFDLIQREEIWKLDQVESVNNIKHISSTFLPADSDSILIAGGENDYQLNKLGLPPVFWSNNCSGGAAGRAGKANPRMQPLSVVKDLDVVKQSHTGLLA
jgi:hypothetical protein